jgi:serine/threonine protein kinase
MLKKGGYSFQVDWWALGTIVYEMLFGLAPFYHDDESEMYINIVKSKLEFPSDIEISAECRDFIAKLLIKDPKKRLGSDPNIDYKEILEHPFLKGVDVEALKTMDLEAPYRPPLSDDMFDLSNFEQEWTARSTFLDARDSINKAELIRREVGSMFKKL